MALFYKNRDYPKTQLLKSSKGLIMELGQFDLIHGILALMALIFPFFLRWKDKKLIKKKEKMVFLYSSVNAIT